MLQALALTGLGGLLAIIGTIFGYYLQAREGRRARSETYEREDRFRLHRDRRESYAAFHLAFGNARLAMFSFMDSRGDPEYLARVREARDGAWATYVPLWHVGADEVIGIAGNLMSEIEAVGWHGDNFDPDRWGEMVDAYVLAVRNDLTGQRSSRRGPEASGLLPTETGSAPSPSHTDTP